MPTYTYRCNNCNRTFDRRNVRTDDRDAQFCEERDCLAEGGPPPTEDAPALERVFEAQVPPRMKYGWGEGR